MSDRVERVLTTCKTDKKLEPGYMIINDHDSIYPEVKGIVEKCEYDKELKVWIVCLIPPNIGRKYNE